MRALAHVRLNKARSPLTLTSSPERIAPSARVNGHVVILPTGQVYLSWPGLFEFRVSPQGTNITGTLEADDCLESFRAYFLGHVLSFALLRQGVEPLHGTIVVNDNNEALALLGNSGYGKSSAAAAFLGAGYRLLSDDLLVLEQQADQAIAFPGVPRLKLFPEVADRFLGGAIQAPRMHRHFSKLLVPLGKKKFSQLPVPLRAIYVLAKPDTNAEYVTIRRLARRSAFLAVLRNTFNTKLTDSSRLRRQFETINRLVSQVPVMTLSYPRTLDLLPEVCEAVTSDFQRRNDTQASRVAA